MRIVSATIICLVLVSCGTTPRPWTRNEKIVLVTSVLATGANIYETDRALDRGCYEVNPAIKWSPVIGMMLSEALVIVISHYYPDVRFPLLGGKAVINTGLAIHDHQAGR